MFEKLYCWRWWIWCLFAAAWSAALLVPIPRDPWIIGDLDPTPKLAFAKGLHVSAYAFFAVITGWLRAPIRFRFVLMFLLMAHGTLTEFLQFSVVFIGRNGNLLDVALDQVGVALGVMVAWRWWTWVPAMAEVQQRDTP